MLASSCWAFPRWIARVFLLTRSVIFFGRPAYRAHRVFLLSNVRICSIRNLLALC